MRILFSLTYYTPYISGLTLYVKRLAEALTNKGCKTSVISIQYDKKLSEREIINRVEVIRAKPLLKISKGFLSVDWIVKSWQEVRKSEVTIISLPQMEGIIPAILGKMFGKKVISIYHCEVVLTTGFFNYLVEKILHLSNMLTLFLSDEIITYTQDFARNSKILARFGNKLKFIYPPVSQPKVNKRIQKLIKKKIGEKPRFTIGVAARLAAEKGIEYLLEAIPYMESQLLSFSSFTALEKSRKSNDSNSQKSYGSSNIKSFQRTNCDIHVLSPFASNKLATKETNPKNTPNPTATRLTLSTPENRGEITDAKNTKPKLAVNSDNLSSWEVESDGNISSPTLSSSSKTVNGSKMIFQIVITGPRDPIGEEAYQKKINNLVKKYKDYVVFLGSLKEEEMGSFYSLIDVLVLPSVNSTEAFGMVQVEAMMMGVPVVATDLPGVRVPIQKTGMGLLVPIKNSQKLAEAIVHLLLNKDKYIKDKKLVEKEFSFEKTIKFYERKIILSQH